MIKDIDVVILELLGFQKIYQVECMLRDNNLEIGK